MGMSRSAGYRNCFAFALAVVVVALLASGLACNKTDDLLEPSPADGTVLTAVYRGAEEFLDNPIVLDGAAIEREWGGVATPYVNVRVSDENGGGGGTGYPAYVSMKAVYTATDLFLLIQWVDSSVDDMKDAMQFSGNLSQTTGCQDILVDERYWVRNPDGRYDEDRLAIAFEIDSAGNSVGRYRDIGCQAACHLSESPAFGRLTYGRLDMWQWLAARTNPVRDLYDLTDNPENPLYGWPGYMDDLICDSFAGLGPDPGSPAYVANFEAGSEVPRFVYRDSDPDDPYARPRNANCQHPKTRERCRKNNGVSLQYVWRDFLDPRIQPFAACDTVNLAPLPLGTEPRKWRPGDLVAGWMLTFPSDSRADIHAKAGNEDGVWTLEIGRRLDTGDPIHDVIFRPQEGREYVFTLAIMDNSDVEQRGSEPQLLTFGPRTEGR